MKHALRRTSPKGQQFIGKCLNCGKENLDISAALEECSNPKKTTQEVTLVKLLKKGNKT